MDTRPLSTQLMHAAEEAGELVQALSKIVRFGPNSVDPNDAQSRTNAQRLEEEAGDVVARLRSLHDEGLISWDAIIARAQLKLNQGAPSEPV